MMEILLIAVGSSVLILAYLAVKCWMTGDCRGFREDIIYDETQRKYLMGARLVHEYKDGYSHDYGYCTTSIYRWYRREEGEYFLIEFHPYIPDKYSGPGTGYYSRNMNRQPHLEKMGYPHWLRSIQVKCEISLIEVETLVGREKKLQEAGVPVRVE